MALTDRIRDVVTTALDSDLILYDLEHNGGVLRVTLDVEGGIDVERLAAANRAISRALDEADPIPGRYMLEVTSPGLERPLRVVDHWRRALGERVRVKLRPAAEAERRIEGVVASVGEDAVEVVTDDGSTRRVDLADVERARTVFEWGPAPKPGATKRTAKTPSTGPTKEAQR